MIIGLYNTFLIFITIVFIIVVLKSLFTKNKNLSSNENKKIAVIIPARNEEKVIDNLLDSLKKQDYPKNQYDIYVIPNNCTDNTEKIASKKAKILKYKCKFKSKGEVLNKVFIDLQDKYDAFAIFDSDNVVDPNFLKEMNKYLCNGSKVIQGYRDTKNFNKNWLTYSYSIFYWLQNTFFSKVAKPFLNGTGFVVSNDVLKLFNATTLTEDVEYATICELNNIKIDFAKKAITYDEQPSKFKTSWIQRKRWTVGVVQVIKKYLLKVIKKFKFNSFFVICNPIWNLIVFLLMIIFLFDIEYLFLYLCVLYVFMILIASFAIFSNKKTFSIKVLLFPIFMFTWMIINVIYLFKKDDRWQHIEHVG